MHDERDEDLTYRGRIALAVALVFAFVGLLLASCARCVPNDARWVDPNAADEYERTVRIEVSCVTPDPKSLIGWRLVGVGGSGVRVGGTTVLTAAHVVDCMSEGSDEPLLITVVDEWGTRYLAHVEAITKVDVARLSVDDLPTMSAAHITKAHRGERACATFALPEPGRRCGEVWASRASPPGDIHVDYVSEHGNSGGPLWDPAGELLGIVVYLHWCQGTDDNKQVCTAGATSLWGRSWIAIE